MSIVNYCERTSLLHQHNSQYMKLDNSIVISKILHIVFLHPIYTLNYLRSINLKNQIERLKVGVAQFNLSLKQVSDIEIPLPPLDVQQEIVEKIESLKADIEELKQKIANRDNEIKAVINTVWAS